MTNKQKKLIESYISSKVKKIINENSEVSPESLESIKNFLNDLKSNIEYIIKLTDSNAYKLKPRILQKITILKHNLGSIEAELNK